MASTISAGTTTTTALVYSADTSGVLQLQTNGGTTALTLDTSQNATFAGKVASASSLQLATNGTTTAVTIDTSQRVLIGTTSGSYGLVVGTGATDLRAQINGSTQYQLQLVNGSNSGFWIGSPSADAMAFSRGDGVERARIDTSGNLLVGTTSAAGSERLNITGSVANQLARFYNSNAAPSGIINQYTGAAPNGTGNEFLLCYDNASGATLRMSVRSNGGIANYTGNNVILSDRREKTNFAPAGSYLNKICAIPVQTFNYIDQNMEEDGGLTLGVVAQDVQAVAPELVTEGNWGTEEDPKMRFEIYQTDLQYALMKSIQELSAQVTTLQTQVTALKG